METQSGQLYPAEVGVDFDTVLREGLGQDYDKLSALGGTATGLEKPYGADQMTTFQLPADANEYESMKSTGTTTPGMDTDTLG